MVLFLSVAVWCGLGGGGALLIGTSLGGVGDLRQSVADGCDVFLVLFSVISFPHEGRGTSLPCRATGRMRGYVN